LKRPRSSKDRSQLPIIIINFDGVIGDVICSNPFDKHPTVSYMVRREADKGLKILQEKCRLIIVKQMKEFSKFKSYFKKKGIIFDGVFEDSRRDIYPRDYLSIAGKPVLVLSCYDIEPDSSYNEDFLLNITTGQWSLDSDVITILVPHLRMTKSTTPNMESIARAVCRVLENFPAEVILHNKAEMRVIKKSKAISPKLPLRDPLLDKLSSLNNEFFILHTDVIYKKMEKSLKEEIEWNNRREEIRVKRMNKELQGHSKKVKHKEMLAELMNSNLEKYDCIHLVNQFSKTEIEYLSEAALKEISSEGLTSSQLTIFQQLLSKNAKKTKGLYLILLNTRMNNKAFEIIGTESYKPPYVNLNSWFPKKNLVNTRRQVHDLDLQSAPTIESINLVYKK